MSHLVTIEMEVRDATAVQAACERLGLPRPIHSTVQLFSGEASGLAVQLPGWHYPVVCQLDTGQVKFDNYNGRWGEEVQLHRFLQAYAIEAARIEARRHGHQATETELAHGYMKVTVHLGEAA
jgi:hypothetical protein